MLVAVRINRLASDVFHREIGLARIADACVVKAGNIRVFELREKISFAGKALTQGGERGGVVGGGGQLHRDVALHTAIGITRAPHAAHAAVAHKLDQLERADLRADFAVGLVARIVIRARQRGEDVVGLDSLMRAEQLAQQWCDQRLGSSHLFEPRVTLLGPQRDGGVHEREGALPVVSGEGHGWSVGEGLGYGLSTQTQYSGKSGQKSLCCRRALGRAVSR